MADIALSAYSVLLTQCPSFLSFQKAMEKSRGVSNAGSLFQIRRIPSDNHIRKVLDSAEPSRLFGLFDDLYQAFGRNGVLKSMEAVHQTQLIALDGTWYFFSQSDNIHCCNCFSIQNSNGSTTHYHSANTPVIVSPGHSHVVPLRPEFIVPQDGYDKQDCEIAAAKRWVSNYSQTIAEGNRTLLGDDIYAHESFCRQAALHGFHFLFTCKSGSHSHLTQWLEQMEMGRDIRVVCQRVKGKRNRWNHLEYRWANCVPLTDSENALKVNWLEIRTRDVQGKEIYCGSWITDWEVNKNNVAELVASARARWKIENEHDNTLKTKGYHLKHNFGYSKQHLASLRLTMNILAFGLHTLLGIADSSYKLIRDNLATRKTFFQQVQALTHFMHFESWERLIDLTMRGLEICPFAKQTGVPGLMVGAWLRLGVRRSVPKFPDTRPQPRSTTNSSIHLLLRTPLRLPHNENCCRRRARLAAPTRGFPYWATAPSRESRNADFERPEPTARRVRYPPTNSRVAIGELPGWRGSK